MGRPDTEGGSGSDIQLESEPATPEGPLPRCRPMGKLEARPRAGGPTRSSCPTGPNQKSALGTQVAAAEGTGQQGRTGRQGRAAAVSGSCPLCYSVCHFKLRGKGRWAVVYFVLRTLVRVPCLGLSPFPALLLSLDQVAVSHTHSHSPRTSPVPVPVPVHHCMLSHTHTPTLTSCTPAHMHPLLPPACHASRSASDV